MTYKSDDITETENENVDQSKITGFGLEQEIQISPKTTKKLKAPIPMAFKVENQTQTQTEPSASLVKATSRTPSPSSNKTLDDIVLISEVIDTLTEMKEPNGKTYFVDEIRTTAIDTPEETEHKTAIEYLDDVLQNEEVKGDKNGIKVDEIGIPTSVVAVIHQNRAVEDPQSIADDELMSKPVTIEEKSATSDNYLKDEQPAPEILNDSDKSIDELALVPLNNCQVGDDIGGSLTEQQNDIKSQDSSPEDVKSDPEHTLNIQEIPLKNVENAIIEPHDVPLEPMDSSNIDNQSNSVNLKTVDAEVNDGELQELKGNPLIDEPNDASNSNSETPMTFKERLAMLLGQQPVPEVRRVSPRQNNDLPHNTTDSKLKHSKSEPDIFNSMVMQGVFKDIRSKYELSDPDGSKKPLQMTTTDDIQIDDSKSTVPVPPKFDPFIYKTIGSRHNTRTALKFGEDDNNEIAPKPPMTAPIIMDNDHNDIVLRKKSADEDDQTRMISIKDRLENILKRGPPDRYSRPKSIVPPQPIPTVDDASWVTVNTTKSDNDGKIDEGDEEVIRIKEAKRPFDTVHKQKVLFNDVLKSIGVETRPSIIRANSITKSRQKPATIEDARNALKHVSVEWEKNVK